MSRRILHINNFFNPGGSTLACYELAKELYKKDYQQHFVGSYFGPYLGFMGEIGQTHFTNFMPNFDYDWDNFLSKIIEKAKPDIIHVWIPGHEQPTYLRHLPEDVKKVATVLCAQKVGFNPSIFDRIIFISNHNRDMSPHVTNGEIIRYGIQDYAYEENEIYGQTPVFGRISAYCRTKKIMDTAQCAAALPETNFVVAGEVLDKDYAQSIGEYIDNKSLTNISLLYNIDATTKNGITNYINVLHYPTSEEAFCLAILEGMRAGKCVISYDNSAIPELNTENNIILCEDGNVEELIDKSKWLFHNQGEIKRLGKLNRSIYEQHYKSIRYASDVINLYERLYE